MGVTVRICCHHLSSIVLSLSPRDDRLMHEVDLVLYEHHGQAADPAAPALVLNLVIGV